ncbi:hypothetical protein JB92DRAFT_3094194 [Gautieria morchelliformis]|nr:hypothetical protein JB92DRAFT_3094194 [Gautieria morchelliformis]
MKRYSVHSAGPGDVGRTVKIMFRLGPRPPDVLRKNEDESRRYGKNGALMYHSRWFGARALEKEILWVGLKFMCKRPWVPGHRASMDDGSVSRRKRGKSHVTNNFVPAHMSEGKKRAYDAGESGSRAGSGSPPRKTQRLDTTPYPATPEEHAQMDEAILRDPFIGEFGCRVPFPKFAPRLITSIVDNADPKHLDQKYLRQSEAQSLLDTEGGLLKELEDAWDAKEFIRDLEILQPPGASAGRTSRKIALDTSLSTEEQDQASSAAWQTPYVAGAHTSFIKTIDALYSKEDQFNYSNHVALIQSSGCGKSRMLHEASQLIPTVIMNFGASDEGFPKSDGQVREYLVGAKTNQQCENRVASFFTSLFRELSKVNFKSPSELAGYLGYGDAEKLSIRTAFFDGVISEACEIEQSIHRQTPPPPSKESPSVPRLDRSGVERTLAMATTTLVDKIPGQEGLNVKLLLGFDESSDLVNRTKDWDAFEKLRRVFRYLRGRPIFGVFLSTTGSVKQFHPASRWDRSSRIQDGTLYLNPPVTLVDYDQLAMKLVKGNTLDDATTMDYMISLGRPLFKTRYDAMKSLKGHNIELDIVKFATHKLLDGQDETSDLPYAFADIMYTVSPSEPVLIEAAAKTIGNRETNRETKFTDRAVHVLHRFLANRFLSKGDRGELACMLLILLGRDMACRAMTGLDTPMRYHTLVPVTDFLTNLFADGYKATVLGAQAYEGGPSLEEVFKDSWTHCTHFLKVTDHKVVNRKFLMRLMARGAGILCADNQLGIDAVVPVCYKGKKLVTENITAIAIQSRNVALLRKPRDAIFTNMGPNYTGISDNDPPGDIPIIKLLLSVGTNTAVLTCPTWKRPEKTRSQSKDVPLSQQHFRFFAAGMSHKVFRPIQAEDEAIWRALLLRSDVTDIYGRGAHESALDIIRRMTPATQSDHRHWDAFFPLDFEDGNMPVDVASDIDDENAD